MQNTSSKATQALNIVMIHWKAQAKEWIINNPCGPIGIYSTPIPIGVECYMARHIELYGSTSPALSNYNKSVIPVNLPLVCKYLQIV